MEYAVASVKKDVDACKFNWSCNFCHHWRVISYYLYIIDARKAIFCKSFRVIEILEFRMFA